uniref:Uncharacterized protein n=1 Tax=Ditylenchus dipsaci TaxID=166011 RepID=A0A915E852_9BILA
MCGCESPPKRTHCDEVGFLKAALDFASDVIISAVEDLVCEILEGLDMFSCESYCTCALKNECTKWITQSKELMFISTQCKKECSWYKKCKMTSTPTPPTCKDASSK